MKVNLLTKCSALIILAVLFSKCQKTHERFDDPPWLSGTNIETLEEKGNYTQFLALMDRADYRTSIESQLFTLFAPNDSSFAAYYEERGITSVEDLSVDEAEELFGQHILINPRSREQLLYEYSGSWGELETPEGEYATLFHRKETYSVPLNYDEYVKYNEEFLGQTLNLYRSNTLVPLFSTEYFEDFFGDPTGSDYLFIYPGSQWTGTQWHNAAVVETGRSSTGFVYYIDKVVGPMPTIDKYLSDNQDDFGLFFDIAQRFATYGNERLNERDEREYRKSYDLENDIADERGPSTSHPGNMLDMFTAFVPYNNVLQTYLDNTVFQHYTSLDSVPQLFLVYLLNSQLNNLLNLPSKMEKRFFNYYGDNINIDINEDIETTIMCSNGAIYAMNRLLEPNVFSCVPGPIFYNKDYTTFLYALDESGLMNTLSQPDINVTLFAANNAEMNAYGIRADVSGGDVTIQIRNRDGRWNDLDQIDLEQIMKDFIHLGVYEDFLSEGFIPMASDNYTYYNNGRLYSGGNEVDGDFCSIVEKIPSDQNGNLFYLDNTLKAPKNAAQIIMADPDLSSFVDLLTQAELIDSAQYKYEETGVVYPRIKSIAASNQWTILAPTNQAIANFTGTIPTDRDELRDFLHYHFVKGKCVFDDGLFSGTATTYRLDTVIDSELIYENLEFTNSVHNLSVTDKTGNEVSISHANANTLIEKGVIHKINTILTID